MANDILDSQVLDEDDEVADGWMLSGSDHFVNVFTGERITAKEYARFKKNKHKNKGGSSGNNGGNTSNPNSYVQWTPPPPPQPPQFKSRYREQVLGKGILDKKGPTNMEGYMVAPQSNNTKAPKHNPIINDDILENDILASSEKTYRFNPPYGYITIYIYSTIKDSNGKNKYSANYITNILVPEVERIYSQNNIRTVKAQYIDEEKGESLIYNQRTHVQDKNIVVIKLMETTDGSLMGNSPEVYPENIRSLNQKYMTNILAQGKGIPNFDYQLAWTICHEALHAILDYVEGFFTLEEDIFIRYEGSNSREAGETDDEVMNNVYNGHARTDIPNLNKSGIGYFGTTTLYVFPKYIYQDFLAINWDVYPIRNPLKKLIPSERILKDQQLGINALISTYNGEPTSTPTQETIFEMVILPKIRVAQALIPYK